MMSLHFFATDCPVPKLNPLSSRSQGSGPWDLERQLVLQFCCIKVADLALPS